VEKIEKFGECSIRECPECNGSMEKIISPVGVIFKGSGFHVNDYKSEGMRKEAAVETGAASIDKDSPAAKSDSPAEAQSESTAPGGDKEKKDENTSTTKVKETKGGEKKKKEKVA
jgi:predicted nucleic acid-binding Zn ribbon protein